MTLLNELNVGSQQYGMMGVVPMGTCATPAGTAIKESAFADDFELSAGNLISVTFTYANTYGDGSTTYPSLKIGSYTYPIKYPTGAYAASGAWADGQAVTFMFDGVNLIMTHPVATAVQAGNNLPVSSGGVYLALNSYVKLVYFNMYNIPANVTYQEQLQLPINTLISEAGRYRVTVMLSYAVSAPKEIGIYYKIGDTVYQMAYTTKSDFPSGESSLNMVSICASAMINEQANTTRVLVIKTSTQSTLVDQTNPMYIFIERLRDL